MTEANQSQATAKLTFPGGEAELPILKAVDGKDAIDVSSLTRQSGYTALDYGYVNTSSTKSAITYIDGEAGILRYRGYPIEELAAKSTFLEVAYLLIYGELPTADQLDEFDNEIRRHTLLHEDMRNYFAGIPHTAHPMAALSGGLQALSTYYESSLDPSFVEVNTIRLPEGPLTGRFAGLDPAGRLELETETGRRVIDAGDLFFGSPAQG